ncbi:Rne/Rng family ribonuclease [Caulobacter mirabilis]|uniref:Ribonuclease E n=1 Tax=Caulobacter mirabilis TaxID=69666 RepID=A0A2D2AYY4_9CAUL|nr:ribonuclease E/G [Caulobacter mirabilis]ATQ43192.1 ribonuclease E/G [Caulobacter mirabilis]
MTKKMLIDAAHPEETRVVVVDGTRVEEFDFESQSKKQLRGNIYLAKVTRVEPSLQAAFIEYGGNRHGFLAFNEIHPDYYQIPLADREALLRAQAEDDDEPTNGRRGKPAAAESDGEDEDEDHAHGSDDEDDVVEEELARRRRRLMKTYKIQEVIRRRQIMLVQVVKEERGNKGAALTTYLSLAGRYGVLMPNTARGGGISRKITTATDRKKLKSIVQSLDVPQGMGLIVRTAGAKRTKTEIKRDYDYLLRLWENIRETTLHSIAPALIYEEEDLVKRAIRDMYDKDIDGVWVEGEAGYKEAREFMRMLMPAQAKKVQPYREPTPLFVAHKVEGHLSQIYSPVVPLKSGGYLVINQTEALVAIDVNSGRATRERNIEATALKTNLEAAEEAARQLRLRDLAGLIVIDFIDMEESKNNRAVEKKLKDALKDDRARIQMGKISAFGLMEISRQRRRSGVLEGTTHVCEHCAGTGRVRSTESAALAALRAVEMEALQGGGEVTLKVSPAVGLYILNEKRGYLTRVHQTHHLFVTVLIDEQLGQADHEIERTASGEHSLHAPEPYAPLAQPVYEPEDDLVDEVEEEEEEEDEEDEDVDAAISDEEEEGGPVYARDGDDDRRGGRGRRRRRRGGRRDEAEDDETPRAAREDDAEDGDDSGQRRRRRGRRGGRRMRDDARPQDGFSWTRPRVPFGDDAYIWHDPAALVEGGAAPAPVDAPASEPVEAEEARPAAGDREGRRRRGRGRGRGRAETTEAVVAETPAVIEAAGEVEAEAEAEPAPEFAMVEVFTEDLPADEIWVELPADPEPVKKPRRSRRKAAEPVAEAVEAAPVETPAVVVEAAPEPIAEPEPAPEPEPQPEPVAAAPAEPDPAEISAPPEKPRRGWWRRG